MEDRIEVGDRLSVSRKRWLKLRRALENSTAELVEAKVERDRAKKQRDEAKRSKEYMDGEQKQLLRRIHESEALTQEWRVTALEFEKERDEALGRVKELESSIENRHLSRLADKYKSGWQDAISCWETERKDARARIQELESSNAHNSDRADAFRKQRDKARIECERLREQGDAWQKRGWELGAEADRLCQAKADPPNTSDVESDAVVATPHFVSRSFCIGTRFKLGNRFGTVISFGLGGISVAFNDGSNSTYGWSAWGSDVDKLGIVRLSGLMPVDDGTTAPKRVCFDPPSEIDEIVTQALKESADRVDAAIVSKPSYNDPNKVIVDAFHVSWGSWHKDVLKMIKDGIRSAILDDKTASGTKE